MREFTVSSSKVIQSVNSQMRQIERACLKHALFLCIEEKYYRGEVAADSQVDHQMPDKVVVFKSLFGVEPCTDGVEDTACGNQYEQRCRCVTQKEWEKEYYSPSHNKIYGKAYCRNRSF